MQISPSLKVMLRKITMNLAKSQDNRDVSAQFLATCYGAAGCADAIARVEGLGCIMCVIFAQILYVYRISMNVLVRLRMACGNLLTGMSTTAAL